MFLFDWSPYLKDGERVLWAGRPKLGLTIIINSVLMMLAIDMALQSALFIFVEGSLMDRCLTNLPRACEKHYFFRWPSFVIAVSGVLLWAAFLLYLFRTMLFTRIAISNQRIISIATNSLTIRNSLVLSEVSIHDHSRMIGGHFRIKSKQRKNHISIFFFGETEKKELMSTFSSLGKEITT